MRLSSHDWPPAADHDGDLESLRRRFGYSRVLRVELAEDYEEVDLPSADLRY